MHANDKHATNVALMDLCEEADKLGSKDAIRAALELAEEIHEELGFPEGYSDLINYLERKLHDSQ